MTLAQMRLFLAEGDRIERQRRAAFIADVWTATANVMAERGGDAVQERIDSLRG